jgi:carbamoyltransferase
LYWGGTFTDAEVEAALQTCKFEEPVTWRQHDDIEARTAELMTKGEVIARAKGRMEFGARALGNRSILADPRNPKVTRVINEMVKMRDFWMPFAPSVLAERGGEYYVKPKQAKAPFMILTFDSRPEKVEAFAAATHPFDRTTRPQEVHPSANPDYYRLLKRYEELTGEGIVLNTSFNLHGFPIVYRPQDALDVLNRSGLKHLALGNFLVSKNGGRAV